MSPRKTTTPAELAAMDAELDQLTARRTQLRQELDEVNARATALNVELYRGGRTRSDLVDRPYTAAYLDRVLGRAGLGARKEKEKRP